MAATVGATDLAEAAERVERAMLKEGRTGGIAVDSFYQAAENALSAVETFLGGGGQ